MCWPEARICCQCAEGFDDSGNRRCPCICPVVSQYPDSLEVEASGPFDYSYRQASLLDTSTATVANIAWVPDADPANNGGESLLLSPLNNDGSVLDFSNTHLGNPTSYVSQQDLAGNYTTHVPAPVSQTLPGDLTGLVSQYFSNSQQQQDTAYWSPNCPPAPGLAAQHMQYGQYQALLQQPHPSLDPHGTESNASSGSQHNSGISSPDAGIGSADVQYAQASLPASAPRPRSMNSRRNGKRIPLVPCFGSTNGVARTPRRPSGLATPAQPQAPPSLPIRKHTREQRREFHICRNCYGLVKGGMDFRRDADIDIRLDSQQCPLCVPGRISTSDNRRALASTIQQSGFIPPQALPEPAQPLQASSLSSSPTAATSLYSPNSSGTSASSMSCPPVFYCRVPICNRAQGADTGDWPFTRKDNCTKHEAEMHGYSRPERKRAPRKPKVAMNANYVPPQLLSQVQSPLADSLGRMDYS